MGDEPQYDAAAYRSLAEYQAATPGLKETVLEIFDRAAAEDGDPRLSADESYQAYQGLVSCEGGLMRLYRTECVGGVLTKRTREQAASGRDGIVPWARHLRLLGHQKFADWLWGQTSDSSLLQSILFSDPDCRTQLRSLATLVEDNGLLLDGSFASSIASLEEVFLQYREMAMRTGWTTEMTDEGEASPHRYFFDRLLLKGMLKATIDEVEYQLKYQDVLGGDTVTMGQLMPALESGNEAAMTRALAFLDERRIRPEALFQCVHEATSAELIVVALRLLVRFQDQRVDDFLIDQIIHGSFNLSEILLRVVPYSSNREVLMARATAMSESSDRYESSVGRRLLGYFRSIPLETLTDAAAFERGRTRTLDGIYKQMRVGVHTTVFFRFPLQLRRIKDELKALVRYDQGQDMIKVVLVGASYGPEAYSLVMIIDSDYQKDPNSWGGHDPFEKIEIVATDISEAALDYSRRGRFVAHPSLFLTDFTGLEGFAKELGVDVMRYFEREGEAGRVYRVKPEWSEKIQTAYLDILDTAPFIAEHGRAEVVVYNMVDGHIEGEERRVQAAGNVADLATYLVTAVPRLEEAPETFGTILNPDRVFFPAYFYTVPYPAPDPL